MNEVTRYKRNILKTWRQVTPEDVKAGVDWYPTAHEIAREIGEGNVAKGAGIIAAFSPMTSWSLNVEMARNAVASEQFVGHFKANNDKAFAIYHGAEPLTVLGGNKVRAFYSQIVSAGEHNEPVIDRHALAVAFNRIASDLERKTYVKGTRYDAVARAYKEVAGKLGIPVSQLQAVTWVSWRRKKGMED